MSNPATLSHMLGILDALAGLVMLWATLRITTSAGICSLQARWALFRRIVYGSTSVSFFALGMGRLDGSLGPLWETAFHVTLVFGVSVFPLLRALNLITQDQFKAVDGSSDRQQRSGRVL